MSERRFDETEVAAIFERAAKAQQGGRVPLMAGEGMTLGELQEIGREVGFSPEQIADAANALARRGRATSRHFLGLTIGVGRTIELDRKITDAEWERLVVDLRETFDARGSLRDDGAFRQWTNGNLQALLEPTEAGHRLRLRTIKGNARAWMIGGLSLLGVGAVGFVSAALRAVVSPEAVSQFATFAAVGLGMFAAGAIQLPTWIRTRRQQMAEVAERLASSTARPGGGGSIER